ncbi:1,2-phenylacetyl-CoA epoxidase subunit PaaC [Fervidibacillus halotolerans]|uniref:Phenylacetate-CoA oxygenase subunit PaaC n=1 Tax=Fervidibacillus halotolerans TaxID=2980027 RepID=A0A9E8RY48_9BACI|nr:1,2-phenylacetyl-CoA epoxidase subunit PaaC [Fervidibacillus halotolerans]WAA11853.1 phenylacetate-CoA oxygenase subunit PaaC [Fervidibacillus halotolerans]
MTSVKNALEARQNKEYVSALTELLFQLADDDFILAFRGSEWLGLAPHIEEDVAFSSITQNMMGHAFMYYQLLEQLGEGTVDELAHERSGKKRKNAIMLEKVNGLGTYLQSPKFDWAFTVVRHYFYDVNKKIKLDCLQDCSYEPLKHAAINIRKEQYYHLVHWETWFKQLVKAGGEAKTRMMVAVEKVWNEFDDVLSLGPRGEVMANYQLIDREDVIRQTFMNTIGDVFENLELGPLPKLKEMKKSGRIGEHTEDLEKALATLTEVYKKEPSSSW